MQHSSTLQLRFKHSRHILKLTSSSSTATCSLCSSEPARDVRERAAGAEASSGAALTSCEVGAAKQLELTQQQQYIWLYVQQ